MPVAEATVDTTSERLIFRTDPSYGVELGVDGVDRKTSTIAGASAMQVGLVKDGRFEIDQTTLKQLNEKGNALKLGAKVRFGHPAMSDDALGSFLGRMRGFRLNPEGTISRGDIYFDETSFRTPRGDLGGYTMDLARSDPSAFGMSVVVLGDREFRMKPDGTREVHPETGEPLPALLRVKELLAVDFVDSPAATNSVFGMNDQTVLSAEAFSKLQALMDRPDFVRRAHIFFSRAFDLLDAPSAPSFPTKEPIMPEPIVCSTVQMLKDEYPKLMAQLHTDAMKEQAEKTSEAVEAERARVKEIVELALSMPCDVDKELLEAIDKGMEFSRAESSFLRVELQARGRETNKPTGLQEDSMPDRDEFKTYEEAWRGIQSAEKCSTQQAMGKAQDRYPKLYSQFLDNCPRKKK